MGPLKEVAVDERSRVLLATCLGAVAGGVTGWLYLTDAGRRFRDQIEPRLDDLIGEMTRVRGTVEKARSAANEGWRSLSEITNGAHQGGRWSA
jgi:outer membrane lipoprotein SlyB